MLRILLALGLGVTLTSIAWLRECNRITNNYQNVIADLIDKYEKK